MWKVIQNNSAYPLVTSTSDSGKWFVPSKGEWSAFGGELGITSSNYSSTYGLSSRYWSSSQFDTYGAYSASFYDGYMNGDFVDSGRYVRLCATFQSRERLYRAQEKNSKEQLKQIGRPTGLKSQLGASLPTGLVRHAHRWSCLLVSWFLLGRSFCHQGLRARGIES